MWSPLSIGILLMYAGVVHGNQVPVQALFDRTNNWLAEQNPIMSEGCKASRIARYDIARNEDKVSFSVHPLDDFEAPRIDPLNSTAGEQWEFDGISDDGKQSFMIGFYRDPSFAFLGTGNLRFYLELSFANASRYAVVEYAEESVVERCPGQGTRGTWRGHGRSYEFEVSEDMSKARVIMNSPEAKGVIILEAIAPPRYADNNDSRIC